MLLRECLTTALTSVAMVGFPEKAPLAILTTLATCGVVLLAIQRLVAYR